MESIRILIVEDHAILRLGLRLLLEGEHLEVVGEAEDGERAVQLTASLEPDVVIMDVGMPIMNGIEAAKMIRTTNQNVKIIMFTSADDDEKIFASLGAGVNGYCLKEISADKLVAGINIVRDGDLWLDSSIAAKVLRHLPGQPKASGLHPITESGDLSKDELQVLHLIVEGLTVQRISQRTNFDEETVRQYELSIVAKLADAQQMQNAMNQVENTNPSATESKSCKVCVSCSRMYDTVFLCCPFDGASLSEHREDPLIGTVFANRYEILSRLGKGGMSVVYKARHIFLKRLVAIKVLNSRLVTDVNNSRRFRQEAEAASSIRHRNVIGVDDFGLSDSGEPYLVMDYIEGESLNDVIQKDGRLDHNRAVEIFMQVSAGLQELHCHGIIHRDLKPSNIMLFRKDGHETACLIDFGIAKVAHDNTDQRLTKAGEVLGSPCYVSPEQAQNLVLDERSDIYSLGCTMYEALSGELPFAGDYPWETMLKHVQEPVVPINVRAPEAGIPEALNSIVMCALQKLPEHRFQSMKELRQCLGYSRAAVVYTAAV